MDDITSCSLAPVSWVIPDGLWSDHAGENNGSGPSYVANIVNAIGQSQNNKCGGNPIDYWGYQTPSGMKSEPTAIFVVWDDWGGWYDHINPDAPGGPGVWQGSAPWGNWYTYGFRVPLLVASAYTGTQNGNNYTGYVSGACGASPLPSCPNMTAPFVHDFGSILAFTEWNFLGTSWIGKIGQNGYPFADNYAPDWNPGKNQLPLLDMFPLTTPRPFQPIKIPSGYGVSYFQNYFTNNPTASPSGPDVGDGDQ